MKIIIINGPNINMLGIREPGVYGRESYTELCGRAAEHANTLGIELEMYQSNHEGALVDWIQQAYGNADGIIINPGAYTHTSIAILDAVKAVCIPTVEVHISKVEDREDFRQVSYIRPACVATITGRGIQGYMDAMDILVDLIKKGE